ncbi:ABC transporter substrate-binding protein [Ornithinimicrobium cryptoxanthini]|uniref:ABC transporter substrate-binding protein n=1 Tax=Ornithinimicrobium cryptoxanthini TaxID=2934161 RepID=A0ABY4YHM1_9MICO|nr:ABC transporter substrate-binding protein [Ornithinimicrobium cryptoxanthini]USQ76026.1 ABC transporter substrate-binding protein [Ornithinimicrobium cryptoxanthini]
MTPPRPTFRIVTALAAAVLLASCGADEAPVDETPEQAAPDAATTPPADESSASADAQPALDAFPVTIDTPTGEVVIEERPERIISLSPSATEILFAIGAGDQVIAADEFSNYPPNAPTTELSGYEPNVEAIVGYEPDLVVLANDINEIEASLTALDIPVIINTAPLDVDSGYDGMAALGLATGHADEAAAAVSGMRAAMEDALSAAPQDAQIRVYHELDETFFSASSHSYIGSVYAAMGVVNIADEADTDQTGYPQLTEEAIVTADPQLILIQSQAAYTAEDVAARPGWSQVSAVKNGNIIVVDSDISSRWGPRLPQLVDLVVGALSDIAVPAGR